jgi:4'-phosphopantetheinyl transferase EntD
MALFDAHGRDRGAAESEIESLAAGLFDRRVLVTSSELSAEPSDGFPEERAAVAAAGVGRQREFATGRSCARRLLLRLGFAPVALPPLADGAPRWPDGVVGSIAHTPEVCVVAVARRGEVLGLGIDIEDDGALEQRLWPAVLRDGERDWLLQRDEPQQRHFATVLFSAKESAYKALHPFLRRPIEATDLCIALDPARSSFCAEIRAPGALLLPAGVVLRGSFRRRSRWVVTGVLLETRSASQAAR